jgi:hypothetical protein
MRTNRLNRALGRSAIGVGLVLLVGAALNSTTGSVRGAPPKKSEKLEAIRVTVAESFAREPGYQPGDFVTRRQVEQALDRVEKAVPQLIKRADRDRLVKASIDDRSFLAEQFKTPQSKPFMRRVAGLPGGFDLLDRMGQMSHGRSTVTRLVRGPDGHKLLEYMLQSKGGSELERMLAKDPGNSDFGKPTGKIYTAEQLTAELGKLVGR